ncbi:autotransporter-associated beta strand repeat-containing protein [Sphingomonas cannabina]|uniref:autotransporter-associated beta strand repeat-containing protein n=1 Tax=Sphingomonas cannabina TaxID=2899123 RepID=UPI001F1E620F|nr:autotransporter-associated beta strand repeat-containing protein [Sphingomonas cannabina]UIJ44831.1 autotransporter-associated beta strand repeat-containing protein [Sphingomonas cannabina]
MPSVAQAQDANRNWDANSTTPGNGGTGTWDTSGLNWSPNTDGTSGPYDAPWNNLLLDNAIFGGTAGTVTLGVPITAHNLTFNIAGYELTGNTLTLSGTTPTISVNTGVTGTATISSVLAGTNGLTKAGAGILFLDGANTFSGGITLSGGTLRASDNAAFGAASNTITTTANATLTVDLGTTENRTVSIGAGTLLTITAGGAGSALYTGSGNLSVGAGTILNNDNSNFTGTVTLNGIFGVAGTVTFTSVRNVGEASSLGAGGTITFTRGDQQPDNITYRGVGNTSNRDWVFSGGSLRRFNNSGSGALTLSGGMSLLQATEFNADTGDFNLQGVISGTGAAGFTAASGRTITLGTANSFTGNATINGAGVVVATALSDSGVNGSLGAGSNVALAGTLSYTGSGASSNRAWTSNGLTAIRNDGTGSLNLTGNLSFVAGGTDTLTFGGSSTGTSTFSGEISGVGGLTREGSGVWELTRANTYSGATTVNGGTLRAGSAGAFGATTGITVNGGTLDLNSFALATPTLNGTGGTVALGSAVLTVSSATNSSYAGSIVGTGGLTKLGAGTLTLTGASTYTGATTVGGGTLVLDFSPAGLPASNILSSASALSMGGGTLTITGAAGEINSQSFNGLTITGGNNTIRTTSGGAGSLTLNLGTITRTGGLANFVLPTAGAITTTNGAGALGGWATVNGTDYAKVVGGNIVAFTDADYTDQDDASLWANGQFISDSDGDADSFFGTVGSSVQLGGLQFTTPDATTTVTIAGGQTLGVDGSIIVAPSVLTNNQTITGGNLTGTSGGGVLGVQQNGAGTLTIASQIVDNTGTIGFTKSGTGRVVVSGSNSYTGATTVAQGTLSVNSIGNGNAASAVGASTADASNLVIQGATLEYTGGTTISDRGFTLTRSGATTAGTISITGAAANLTFSGQVTSPDAAGLTKIGDGTLTLTNAGSDYTGITTISDGTLAISSIGNGGGASTLGASSAASTNLVLQTGGELEYTGGTASTNRGFTLGTGGGAIDVAQGSTTLTVSGVAAGTGTLSKSGAGTLILSGVNTYSGGTIVNAGILRAGSTQAFGTGTMTVNAGGTLDVNNQSLTIGSLAGSGTVTNLGTSALTLSGGTSTFSGVIGGSGALIRTGAGVQTFSGCNNTYTGATTINSGTISTDCLADGSFASGIGASGNASSNLVFIGGRLTYTGANVSIDRGFTLQSGNNFLNVNDPAASLEFEGVVTGAGTLNKEGAGTLVLSGANTHTGNIRVFAGVLRAGADNAFGPQGYMTLDNTAGVLLDLNDNDAVVTALIGGGANGGNIDLGSGTLTISAVDVRSYAGAISGTGDLVMTANVNNVGRVQELTSCSSTYDGTTTVSSGVLAVSCLNIGGAASSIGDSGAAAGNLVLNGGTLRYIGAGGSTDRLFTLGASSGSKIEASGTGALAFTNTGAIAFDSPGTAQTIRLGGTNTANNSFALQITDNGSGVTSFTKEDAGTWILTNTGSTYTGVTSILGGVLGVDKLADGGQASSIGRSGLDATNLVIGSGSTLRYTGAGDSTNRLFTLQTGVSFIESSGTGAITFTNTGTMGFQGNGTRIFALGGTNTDVNIMGVSITDGTGGATTVAKNDTGNWYLTGNSTYTGPTNINAGTLFIGNGGTTGSITSSIVNVTGFGALGFNRSDTVTYAGTIQGSGGVTQAGTGTTILTGNSTYTGGTTISAGTLQLGNGGATGSIGGSIANSGTLAFNRNDAYTFGGTITGTGTIAQIGTGTTTLTAANTAGAATISAGTLNVNGALTTQTVAMTGTSTLNVNATMGAAAGGIATFTGDTGASTININSGGTLRAAGDLGGGRDVINVTGALNTGAGTLSLGDGNDTLVFNDPGTFSGSVAGGTGTDALQVNNANFRALNGANVTGFETLTKTLGGILTLTGDHSYVNGVTVAAGRMEIGDGTATGTLVGDIANSGTLRFNRAGTSTYAGAISGTGFVQHNGSGTTIFTGSSTYTGATGINAGTLLINGNQSGATGLTSVASGATLGGTGTIGGNVNILNGGTLAAGSNGVGTLTINGNLTLANTTQLNFEFGQANVPGGLLNDLVNVGGNLTLDGTLNVTQSAGGTFGPGVYRMFNYGGTLTDNGVTVGSPGYLVQTSVANQVNLVNSAGLTLSFWDGDAGPRADGVINGGSGTWRAAGDVNWTDNTGIFAAPFANTSFAIFQGTGGTVAVDNTNGPVQAVGMQFAANGYTIQGGDLTLVDDSGQAGLQSTIRVGDGTPAGAGYTATIASNLSGTTQLVKTDAGTLVLSGTNTYTGGTAINGGTLSISADANLGDATGGLSINGGTLNTTATFGSNRAVDLAGAGTFLTDAATTLTLNGAVSGAGALTKDGAGALVLTAANSYAGGTTVSAGTLQIGNGGTTGSIAGNVANSGTLAFNRSDGAIFAGTISGTGAIDQAGTGATILTADSSYTGGTTISQGMLQLGNGGTSGSIVGNVANQGTLTFNRSSDYSFAGTISGTGTVRQEGTGTTILTAANSYTGSTVISSGTLLINGNQTAAVGATNVLGGGALGGIGTIGGDVFVGGGATLTPGDATGPGTLHVNGNLGFSPNAVLAYEFGQSNVVGGPLNDLTEVAGDLALDGTIDVTVSPGGSFGPGLYRVISYGGALTNNGLDVGTMPAGSTVAVQTSIDGQVNLVNAAGGTFNFWDGAAPANESNNSVDGGDGTWQNSSGNNDWTATDGAASGAYTDASFAIFAAAAGTVDIDNSLGAVTASGLQFASDGYTITGQNLTLVGPESVIRVGDGTAAGLGMTATLDTRIFGATQLVKADLGTLVLTRANTYSGGTRIDAGTLRISGDTQLGDAAGALSLNGGTLNTTTAMASGRSVNLLGTGTLLTDAGTSLTLFGSVSGAGGFTKAGTGILMLTGNNSFGGDVAVTAGQMFVNGDQSAATGAMSVASGATLSGSGIIGGNVALADGAALDPGGTLFSVGTLTINGNLALSSGSVLDFQFGEANVAGGTLNDLVNVGGNLTLDGTINVSVPASGSFGPGIYRVFNYGGSLTDSGLALGTLPGGSAVSVQTAVAGQVNLVNTAGLTLSFWDGDAGPKNDGAVNGGNGVWRVGGGSNDWTDATGAVNADYAQNTFAIFSAAPGTVTVDNAGGNVLASGMQFASDGYTVTGGPLTLTGAQAIVQVGDGSVAGASFTATIASELTGSAGLVKTDAGRLILTGTNSYTGGTTIDGGTLQIGNGGATGSITGDIDNEGALVVDRSGTLNLDGTISGTGSLTKRGSGVLTLTGINSYSGGTLVDSGTVQISSDANLGDVAGTLSLQGGTLQAGASFTSARDILVGSPDSNRIDTQGFDVTLTGTIGNGANNQAGNFLDKIGSGTLTLTGVNTYANRTVIAGGTLALAGAGTIGAGNLVVGAGTVFDISQADVGARVIQLNSGPAGTIALGSKTLTLGFGNSFSDWSGTITDGGIGGGTGGSVVVAAPNGAVRFFEANSYTGGTTVLSGSFELIGNGSLYAGGAVDVKAGGAFSIAGLAGPGTTIGDLSGAGAVALGGKTLTFGTSNSTALSGAITGTGGALVKTGTGTFTMSGANSYTGTTDVTAGTLLVNGNQSAATGLTSVASGATLGGTGTIGGDVVIADGATLTPGAGGAGALTINGDLSLGAGSQLAFEFGRANAPGDPLNDVVNVGGDLTLDGTLNVAVTPSGAFDIGLYRIANYAGTLTDNGLALGTLPAGADVFVQTAVANQVNLINVGGATLNFWDGAAGPKFNGAVDGGDGVWQAGTGNDNWADATGAVNAPFDDGAFAIFTGTAGTVTIDNGLGAVTASGLQFAANGYTIAGDALTLTGPQSVIRVGDGTAGGAGYTATIASELAGNTQLVKTDLGTLVLTGANSYTGGTAINGGTVRIASDANLGAASGGLSFNGGALNTTASFSSGRSVDLADAGTLLTDAGTTLTLTGAVSGAGSLTKSGAGTLVLSGTGAYAGATSVAAGALLVNGNYAGATGATTVAAGASLGGTGTIGGDVTLADGATLTPGAGGAGTLTVGGNLSLSAGTTLAYEFGQAGVAGGALNDLVNIGGDLILDGTIDVTVPTGGAFDVGVYRVFNYGGTLTNNGLTLGTLPGGSNVAVQTSIAGQVNLVNSAGLALGFWDGAAGPKNDGVIQGGNGIWQASAGNDNWTNAGGTVNAAYSDGAFAVFGGTGGTVTVDNGLGQVTAAGLQFAANGYTITGGSIALTGPQSTIRVGDGSTAGAGFTATINAALSGDTQLIKTDAGTLVLGGTNSYTGGTAINGGTVRIAADANLGAAAGGVSLDGGTLAISASLASGRAVTLAGAGTISTADATTFTLGGQLTGTGALTKAGAGTLLLTGDSSGYTGATTVAAGTLAVTGKLGSAVAVNGGSRLEGTGAVGSVANAGIVAPGQGGFGTLTVGGSYTGSGGRLEIETVLGGDSSQTDRLVVNGGTAGSTTIDVVNRGGLGAQTVEGIKIIDVTGTSDGSFTLNGDYVFQGDPAVIAGAYGYRLYKGGVAIPTDGDWYLRSALLNPPSQPNEPQAPLYQPGVPIYEAYGQTLLTLTEVGTLQQRIGNRQWAETESGKPSGIWGRMQSSRSRPNAAFSTSLSDVNVDSWKLEVGADHVLSERSDGASLVLGVLGGYGEAIASIGSIYGNGSIKTKGYSAGATLTWFGPEGFYVDGRAQVTWFDSKLRSTVLGTLADGNNGTGQAYSVEVGKRSSVGRTLSVTPQIQVVYQTVKFDRFTDPNGALVSSDLGDSLKTRWGLSVDRQDARSHLYGVANLSYEWLDGTVTDVSGTPIARQNHRLWGELGLGGSLLIGDRLTLFTETSANTALNDFAKSYSLKAIAGLRLAF